MDYLKDFLADPIVSFIGYALTVISGLIAIAQTAGKTKAKEETKQAQNELYNIAQENNNLKLRIDKMNVTQGEKSQFFQQNSGPVNIDNRG